MGLFDSAKEKLTKSFGDEAVRVVNYDLEEEKKASPAKPTPAPKPSRPKPQKAARPERPKKASPSKPAAEEEAPEASPGGTTRKKRPSRGEALAEKKAKLEEARLAAEAEEERRRQEAATAKAEPRKKPVRKGAFLIDEEEDFLDRPPTTTVEDLHGDLPDVSVKEGRIQDVLALMSIAPTFELQKDIFMPQDLEEHNLVFDLQTPYGYDQGQVDLFLAQVRGTVHRYYELLTLRNDDVAKLASVVDKLQVDASNLKYQAEIANGIALMPSSDTEELESRLMSAEVTITRLREKLAQAAPLPEGQGLTDREREKYDALQDENSSLRHDNNQLQEEVQHLRAQLAYLEENNPTGTPYDSLPAEELPSMGGALPFTEAPPVSLPPEEAPPAESTVFAFEEEDPPLASLPEDASAVTFLSEGDQQPTATYSSPEDEEDELDKLMQRWNQK